MYEILTFCKLLLVVKFVKFKFTTSKIYDLWDELSVRTHKTSLIIATIRSANAAVIIIQTNEHNRNS